MEKGFFNPQIANCDEHGEFTTYSYYFRDGLCQTRCPICRKIKSNQEHHQTLAELKKENQLAAIRSVINRAAVPPAFQHCTFDNYEIYAGESQQKVFNNLRYFAQNFKRAQENNVHGILTGATGTGKTHLASAVINELINNGYTAVFATMSDITNSLKSAFTDKGKSKKSIADQFVDIDLLIIDEAGISNSNFDRDEIFDIINRRYSLKRPTLLITNIIDDLKKVLGHRIVSRVQQGKFIQVFNWDDYRVKELVGNNK